MISRAFVKLTLLDFFAIAAGVLLMAGLWTPIAALVSALFGLWITYAQLGDPWANVLLITIGISLAMVGPGAWSLDGWLFGWKRIDIGNGNG